MQVRPIGLVAILLFALCSLAVNNDTRAQTAARQLALRSGESIDLYPVYYVANCRSIMIGLPEIEVLLNLRFHKGAEIMMV